jgi:hypothetical protein
MHCISDRWFSMCELDHNTTPERMIVKSAYPGCCSLIEHIDGTSMLQVTRKEPDLRFRTNWKDRDLSFQWFIIGLHIAVAFAPSRRASKALVSGTDISSIISS